MSLHVWGDDSNALAIAPVHVQRLDEVASVHNDSPVSKELETAVHVTMGSRFS